MSENRPIDRVKARVRTGRMRPLVAPPGEHVIGMVCVSVLTMPDGDRFLSLLAVQPDGDSVRAGFSPRRAARLMRALEAAATEAWGADWRERFERDERTQTDPIDFTEERRSPGTPRGRTAP